MCADKIKVNGFQYDLAIKPMCYPLEEEPTKEFVGSLVQNSDITRNMLSDIIYYDTANQLFCQAALHTPPPKGELRLDDLPSAKILYVDRESKKEVTKIDINCANENIKDKIEDILDLVGVSTDGSITNNEYSMMADELKRFGFAKSKLITISVTDSGEGKIDISIDVQDVPKKAVLISSIGSEFGLSDDELAELNAAVGVMAAQDPTALLAVFYEPRILPRVLASSESARGLSFTPVITGAKVEGDVLVIDVVPQRRLSETSIDWSPEYKNYLYSLSAEEQDEATEELVELRSFIYSSQNMQDLEMRMFLLKEVVASGVQRGKKNYILLIDRAENDNGLSISLGRVESPRNIAPVEGDFPPEDKERLNDLVRPALRGATVDMRLLGEGMDRIREYYIGQGYKIKTLKYEITQDRSLHVIVDLRRWDSIYSVEILETNTSDEEKVEGQKLINEIIQMYNGKFIRTEDLEAIKKKLGRGGLRPRVREIIGTDEETNKTKVVFVTAKEDKEYALSLGGGGGMSGMMLNTSFEMSNDGSGRSVGGGISFGSKWPAAKKNDEYKSVGTFFSDWWAKDMYLGSVNLFMTTPLDENKSLTVMVYGWRKNYEESKNEYSEEWVTGAGATYNQYFLNDKVILSLGSNVEYIQQDRPIEGYNDFPVRFKFREGICYKSGGTAVCVNNTTSFGTANYDKASTHLSHTIPLSSEENMPFIILRTSGGVMMGGAPYAEQFSQFDTGMPFMFSVADGEIHFGKYFGGAAVELAQMLNTWLGIKPLVATVNTIGKNASVAAGSCVDIGPLEACIGYRYGFSGMRSGWEVALGMNDLFQIPIPNTLRMIFANTFLRDRFDY